eukprot:gene12191-17298_t
MEDAVKTANDNNANNAAITKTEWEAGIADQPNAANNDDDNAAAGSTDGNPRNQPQPRPTQPDDGAGQDGAQPTSVVGPAVGAAVAVFFLAGVAGYCCMKRKEEKERDELALARSRRAPTRNNPTFDVGGAHGGEEEVAAEPTPAHSAARTAANAESSVAVYIEPNLFQAEVYDAAAVALNKAAGLPPQPTYATIADSGSNGSDLGVYTEPNPLQAEAYDTAAAVAAAAAAAEETKAAAAAAAAATAATAAKPQPAKKDKKSTTKGGQPRCARGDESGGRACNHPALPGTPFCENHSCEHAACAKSKSSGDDFCANHLPTGVRPRAATTTAPLPDDGAAPAEYDVLEPGYVYADLKGGQQTYGSTGGAGGGAGQGVPSAEPRKVATVMLISGAAFIL